MHSIGGRRTSQRLIGRNTDPAASLVDTQHRSELALVLFYAFFFFSFNAQLYTLLPGTMGTLWRRSGLALGLMSVVVEVATRAPQFNRKTLALYLLSAPIILSGIVSILFNSPNTRNLSSLYADIPFILVLVISATIFRSLSEVRIALLVCVISSLPGILLGLFSMVSGVGLGAPSQFWTGWRLSGTYTDPNYFALDLVSILVCNLCLYLSLKSLFYRMSFYTIIYSIFMTFSRTGWVSTIPLIVIFSHKQWKVIVVICTLLLLSQSFIVNPFAGLSKSLGLQSERLTDLNDRAELWRAGYRKWLEAPLIGQGVGWLQASGDAGVTTLVGRDGVPHNMYLSIMIERGIIGLAAWVAPPTYALFGLVAAWRRRKESAYPQEFEGLVIGLLVGIPCVMAAQFALSGLSGKGIPFLIGLAIWVAFRADTPLKASGS